MHTNLITILDLRVVSSREISEEPKTLQGDLQTQAFPIKFLKMF